MVDKIPKASTALTQPPKPRISKVLWIGLAMLVSGFGPLLTIGLLASLGLTKDPNPNAVGPGILMVISIPPSMVFIVIGLVRTTNHFAAAREQATTKDNVLSSK